MVGQTVVIGNGLLASAFRGMRVPGQQVVVFASGVANSLEIDESEFLREERLLREVRAEFPQGVLLYFGTCSVYDQDRLDTPYVRHKLRMESFLAETEGEHLILRLPLAIGASHRAKTLPHFLFDCIRNGKPFNVWSRAMRYPVDVDDVVRIADRLLMDSFMRNRVINVALGAFPVIQFVRVLEAILDRKAVVHLVDQGGSYDIDCPEVKQLAPELSLDFSEGYLEKVLHKYFTIQSPASHDLHEAWFRAQ